MDKFTLLKKIVLILGIVIVLNLFFNYGVDTFYDAPEYDDFCQKDLQSQTYETKEMCEEVGGFWTERGVIKGESVRVPSSVEDTVDGWCDTHHTCSGDYNTARDFYNRNVFVILVVLGIASIIVGFMITASEAVSSGLAFGGILSLIIGSMRYWSAMNDYLRFIILGLALIVLIWIGIKKFNQ